MLLNYYYFCLSLQVEDYMDQLPNHKIPRIGSAGERYRDLQLIRQLPKQDLDHVHCRMIHNDIEIKEYNIFRELRDSIALDIGLVKESEHETVKICLKIRKIQN